MKKDTEVKLFMQYRRKGLIQARAAAKAGIGKQTAHKYERASKLPSELKRPPGGPDPTRSRKIGPGWSPNWSPIQPCREPPCLRGSVSAIRIAIAQLRCALSSDRSPSGVPSKDQSAR